MDFWYKVCCCCCHREEVEKNPLIIGDTLQYFNKLQKRRQSEAANLWNEPVDSTHMERDDDHALYMLLQKRSKMRRGSEGYRRLSFDIIAHRQIRRKMKDRWKQVLEVLGFKAEADGLLTVTSTSTSYESLRNAPEARKLLGALAEQTTIFGHHRGGPPERYLFVLDRLLLLDVGDDFLSAARHFYPVEEEEDMTSSSDGGPTTPGPVLVKLSSGAEEEAEEDEEADVEEAEEEETEKEEAEEEAEEGTME